MFLKTILERKPESLRKLEAATGRSSSMVTLPQNADLVRRAGMTPVATIGEALEIAYKKCGTKEPRITLMPQGANTLPVLEAKP